MNKFDLCSKSPEYFVFLCDDIFASSLWLLKGGERWRVKLLDVAIDRFLTLHFAFAAVLILLFGFLLTKVMEQGTLYCAPRSNIVCSRLKLRLH